MRSDFEEFNLFVYYSLVNGFLDLVIWSLGPYADQTRDYGRFRHWLAAVTRRLCRIWLALRDAHRRPV